MATAPFKTYFTKTIYSSSKFQPLSDFESLSSVFKNMDQKIYRKKDLDLTIFLNFNFDTNGMKTVTFSNPDFSK